MTSKPRLKTFKVFLKKHGEQLIQAHGYKEDKRAKRTIFYRTSNESDCDAFILTSEIVGVSREFSAQEMLADTVTHEEFNKLIEGLPTDKNRPEGP